MQITEVIIHPTDEDPVGAYVTIVFDNCFLVADQSHQGQVGAFRLNAKQETARRHARQYCLSGHRRNAKHDRKNRLGRA
jgi:DNA-binding cell septation regulator SpoVG